MSDVVVSSDSGVVVDLGPAADIPANLSVTNLTVTGSLSASLPAGSVTGTLAVTHGGTGQTTASTAINALLPTQTGNANALLTTNASSASWTHTPSVTSLNVNGLTISTDNVCGGLTYKFDNGAIHVVDNASLFEDGLTVGVPGSTFNESGDLTVTTISGDGSGLTGLQASSITGTLGIANGGTGQTTAANAINALLPTQTSNNGKFLSTNGTSASWSSVSQPTAANPTGTIGLSAVNGSASTFLRSDGAPAISQAITPTWTGLHVFNNASGITTTRVTIGANLNYLDFDGANGLRSNGDFTSTGNMIAQGNLYTSHTIYGASGLYVLTGLSSPEVHAVDSDGSCRIWEQTAGHVALTIKGATSQSADLTQWKAVGGSTLASMSSGGDLSVNNATVGGTLAALGLPDSDPAVFGALWADPDNGYAVKQSQG